MGIVKDSAKQADTKREFVGKAWINVTKSGEHEGVEYIKLVLDRGKKIEMNSDTESMLLWPNNKREGKKDADYRVSLVENQQ